MRRRIIICLGLLLALCLLGNTIAMISLRRSVNSLQGLAKSHRVQSMRMGLVSSSIRLERDVLAFLAGHEQDSVGRPDSVRQFEESVGQCRGCHHGPVDQATLDSIDETYSAYREKSEKLFAATDAQAKTDLQDEALALAHRLAALTTEITERAGRHVAEKDADVSASIDSAWLVLFGTLAAVLVTGGCVAYHLERHLHVPVADLLEGIERIRSGDQDYRFALQADAEFRALGDALNNAYTSVRSAHENVVQAEKMATVGRLAAGVAHEVGNPLASISSIAQVMRRQCASEEQAPHIELIMQEVARITRIVRELLTFAGNGTQNARELFDIGLSLEYATNLVQYDKRAKRVTMHYHRNENLPWVRGDSDKLLLTFTNIMMNALDAMHSEPQADGTLTISTECVDSTITIRFTDTGSGMTDRDIAQAFEPFFTTKEPGVGTGLGLWMCYQVIDAHHGAINITSQVGEGTTVTITLPVDAQTSRPANADDRLVAKT